MKPFKKGAIRAAGLITGLLTLLIWTVLSLPGSGLRVATANPGARPASHAAMAMTFTVMNLNDSGPGSLRDAIDQANMSPGADAIDFADELSGTITLTSGELFITEDLTITGPGVFSLNVSGNHASRVFAINTGVTVDISGMTISDGQSSGNGGGIFTIGNLTLTNVVISGSSSGLGGGGIFSNIGTLTITSSTLSGNSATTNNSSGGGILSNGMLTINTSTLSGNSAVRGGGILSNNTGTLTITNSTLSGNSASNAGGGIYNSGTANISFTTLSDNSASSAGGGLFVEAGAILNIKNSIVANSLSGGDCASSGTFNATGVNFTTNGTCPGFTQVTSAQLNLGPLQDNGGPTQTHALRAGSVAIDAATNCTDVGGNPVGTDQRGIGRPQGAACDVGAYELVPCNQPPTIICPEDFSQSTDPDQCAAVVSFTPPQIDCPCSGGGGSRPKGVGVIKPRSPKGADSCSVACAPPSGATFPRGTTTVTCTATDAIGNTAQCSFTITIVDMTPPALACPANVTQSTDPDQCQAVVSYTVTATDNCDGPVTPMCSPPSGSTFQKGTTTVTCTAKDSLNNESSCAFPVTVNDTQPPALTCPASITTKTAGPGANCVVVTYTTPTATDNCPLPPNPVVCTPASGTCFPRGTTTVTCTATDSSGNTAQCSFRVTVFDLCLQDDSIPSTVVLVNTSTGDYRFCCGGTTFTGRGKVTIRGNVFTLEHNTVDRRVLVNSDESAHRGTASLQVPPGTGRCTITDRDNRNNNCACQ